ncbi:DUF3037 domain-containing protein [Ligilactobacillus murinus]|uniref:DUF3037 domain-containing protein n=1 Tax=Ligilactobacillus murinus TaxID=1622 RepID=UPI0014425168|nr:DUF3037 domain-containing protein [Ligilactobacillus murinus]
MARQKYTFTVISYVPDYIRNEQINIGVIIFDSNNDIINYSLLPEYTNKLSSLFKYSTDSKNLFKETIKFTDFLLNRLMKSSSLPLDVNISNTSVTIDGLPENIFLSPLTYGASENPNRVLEALVETYVGTEFYHRRNRVIASANEIVKSYFKNHNFINKNLLPNPTFKPNISAPFKYKADYAYLDKKMGFSIINLMPSTDEGLERFYQKNAALSARFEKYGDMVFLYDSDTLITEKKQIITDLSSTNKKIRSFDVTNASRDFDDFKKFSNTNIRASDSIEVGNYIAKNMYA